MKLKAILIMVAILAIAGTTYYFVSRPKPAAPAAPHYYVWSFDMQHLQSVTMSLPKQGLSQSFVKNKDDSEFYFAPTVPGGPDGPMVDNQRWGGGIPLLLSGPGANRLILQNATDDQLAQYGFDAPNFTATLTLDNDSKIYEVQVGDLTPDGTNYYTRLTSSGDIFTVDKSWYDVLSGIITNPPYVPATFSIDKPIVSATDVAVGTPVNISINVTNTGNMSGSYDLIMKVNGDVQDTKTVTLDGQATQAVIFTLTENVAGKYIVSINTRNVTFTVQ